MIVAHSRLFSKYQGRWNLGWYIGCGDGTTTDRQRVFIDEMDAVGANVAVVNLMNEDICTVFEGEYMKSPYDQRRIDLLGQFYGMLKARGKMMGVAFFDGPASDHPRYPFLRYWDRHVPFLEQVTPALAPYTDVFFIGIETNRYASIEDVEGAISVVTPLACRIDLATGVRYQIPVSMHEQNVGWQNGKPYMIRRVPRNAPFAGLETSNHPHDGDTVDVLRMCQEVDCVVESMGDGRGVFVMESNASNSEQAKRQNNSMAYMPGVIGIDGVM